jgi:LPS export ABC transporter protein LptC
MITQRNSIWLIPLFFFLTFPIWRIPVAAFLAPRGGYDPEFASRKADEHNFVIDNADIMQIEMGQKTADIKAEKALTGKQPNDFILETVDADIFSEDGERTNITARNGLYNTITRQLTLSDDVVVIREKDNFRLYTDLLNYYDETKKVICPGKTKVIGEGVEIRGGSMSYYTRNRTYNVGGRVHTIIQGFGRP